MFILEMFFIGMYNLIPFVVSREAESLTISLSSSISELISGRRFF